MLISMLLTLMLEVLVEGFKSPGVYQVVPPVDHAEAPSWDWRKGLLYFVNMHAGEIYSYNFGTEVVWSIKLDGDVAPVVQSKNNPDLLIIGLNRSVVAVEWDGRSNSYTGLTTLSEFSQQFPTSRVNDGKADKDGRFWIGTMGNGEPGNLVPNEGVLYRITKNDVSVAVPMVAPVNISNGIAWNRANDKMYYIDTSAANVVEYFYSSKGNIEFSRVVFNMADHPSLAGDPDGMTIDENDNLWIALFGGGSIIQIDSKTGKLLNRIAMPAKYVTSVMWGGPKFDILFVTTSRISLNEQQRKEQPAAGSVFAVVGIGTRGLPMYGADLVDSIEYIDCRN